VSECIYGMAYDGFYIEWVLILYLGLCEVTVSLRWSLLGGSNTSHLLRMHFRMLPSETSWSLVHICYILDQ
jgi:hypothetical protein